MPRPPRFKAVAKDEPLDLVWSAVSTGARGEEEATKGGGDRVADRRDRLKQRDEERGGGFVLILACLLCCLLAGGVGILVFFASALMTMPGPPP